jgi:hypothetical protein
MQCLLPWISDQHLMNIHVNINLHQQSGLITYVWLLDGYLQEDCHI